MFELFLRSAKKLLHALTSPNKCALTLTTTRFLRRLMTARLMLIVLPKLPMCSALRKIPIATFCMLSIMLSTCPLFSHLTTILTLYDDHFRKHATCSNPLPDFENTVLMLTWHSDTYAEHVTDVLRASPISLRFLLHKLSTRFERRIHIQLHLQFENYLKQRPPFNGYMFVRQDKIPDQLKLCSVRILRRRMVRYLSNGANFTRIGDNDEAVLAALRYFIFSFLRRLHHTILDDTWDIWNFELLARVLDRDKPKGGSRPVCNNQNVVTTLLDKLCACTTTECLGIIEAHVRSLQTIIGSDQNMPLHMMWSIRNIQHFVDLIPTRPIPHILHDHNTLEPTSVFSDVSGCFNNVPQGYPRSPSDPPDPGAADDSPTVQIFSLINDIQQYCDTACDTLPAHGRETLELMCDNQDISFHKKTVDALSQLLDGWHSDIFINRDKLDIRMFQDAMITKAFHCRSVLSGTKYDDVVLQIRVRDDDVHFVGWDSIERLKRFQTEGANTSKLRSCVFLDHRSAKQILAVLIMSQTLRVGNAVVLSLLGVMQGSYSGAQSIDGILTVSEIGFCISMLVSKFKWVLPYYALTTRYVDDSAFLTNPFASWLLPLVYPIQGLKFTVDVVQADSERREYLGIHVTMTSPVDGWYSMHTAWYAKKHSIPAKYGLNFNLKPSFLCHDRPIASSKGLIAGDVFRLIQACSNTGVFFVSIQRRVAYLSDEVLISTKFILQQIIHILSDRMLSLIERFQWHNEPAALAAADLFFRQLLTCVHPMTKLVPDRISTAAAGHRKLMSSLFRHHHMRRSQYPPANPAFELEFRSTFSVRCRDIGIAWKRHLVNTPDSVLDLEHHEYRDQKRSLENEIILSSSLRTLPTHRHPTLSCVSNVFETEAQHRCNERTLCRLVSPWRTTSIESITTRAFPSILSSIAPPR